MEGKHVLFFTEAWGLGGIETFVMNAVRALGHGPYSFEIFSVHDWSDAHDEELARLCVERHVVFHGNKPSLVSRFDAGRKAWRALLERKSYDVVHVNAMNGLALAYAADAKRAGVPLCIAHSHNTDFGEGCRLAKGAIHRLGRVRYACAPDVRLACSEDAGRYLFGSRPFTVLKNGIDVGRFAFDGGQRAVARDALGISDEVLLFGAVGRIDAQKNPVFQVAILRELVSRGVACSLLLVGSGPLEEEVLERAREWGVADRLIMPGPTRTPGWYLSALDAVTMPSEFEGLPFFLVEAVDNGLPCFVTEGVGEGAFAGAPIEWLVPDDPALWAEKLSNLDRAASLRRRPLGRSVIEASGFDCAETTRSLDSIYAGERG